MDEFDKEIKSLPEDVPYSTLPSPPVNLAKSWSLDKASDKIIYSGHRKNLDCHRNNLDCHRKTRTVTTKIWTPQQKSGLSQKIWTFLYKFFYLKFS